MKSIHVIRRWLKYFFLVNRDEHQKLNRTTTKQSFGWVSGVQLGLRQTQALISINHQTIITQLDDCVVIGSTNQSLCRPKAELYTKKSIKRQVYCFLVEFLVYNSAFGRSSLRISTYHIIISASWMHSHPGCTGSASTVHRQYMPGCTDDDVIGTNL